MQSQVDCGERVAALRTFAQCATIFHQQYKLAPPQLMVELGKGIRETDKSIHACEVQPATPPIGGAVPVLSNHYIQRDADGLVFAAIDRHESLVLIKGPRQTGKSSLMARGIQHSRTCGFDALVTNFDQFSEADLHSMESVCLRMARSIAEELELVTMPDNVWNSSLGPHTNLERYLHRHVLTRSKAPLLWGLDGIDRIFGSDWQTELFAMIRSWHEKRAFEPQKPWNRLSLILACATEAHHYIRDINKSPFNVGVRVLTADFTLADLQTLNARYDGVLQEADIRTLHGLLGGHPFLAQRCLSLLANGSLTYEELLATADQETGVLADHLLRVRLFVQAVPELEAAVSMVISGKPCPVDVFARLKSAGVLAGEAPTHTTVRCPLYLTYLRRCLS